MEERFTHTINLDNLISPIEMNDIICNDVMNIVNDDIKLYGKVFGYSYTLKDNTYSFHIKLYDHHGVKAESYIRDLIDKELFKKERYYDKKNN